MKNKIIYAVILMIVFILVLNINSYASTITITNFDFNVIVNEDGSMQVEEKVTFKTNNNIAWISWPLNAKNAQNRNIAGLKLKILGVTVDGEESYCINTGTGGAEGINHKYEYTQESDTLGWVKMHTVYNEMPRTIGYKYLVQNTILKNTDVAELYLCPIWNGWDNKTEKLTINVTLPKGAANDEILVYAHGPNNSSGYYEVEGNSVKVEVNDIGHYRDVYTRILFSPDSLSEEVESTNIAARERYEKEEKEDTSYTYEEKTTAEIKGGIGVFVMIFGTAAVLLAVRIFSRRVSV